VAGGKKVDQRLVLALAGGASVADAAVIAGMSKATAFRRMADPVFRARVEQAKTEMMAQAVGVLARVSTKAAGVLEALLDSPTEKVRLAAARSVLQIGADLRASQELEARLANLERVARRRRSEVP
jgi:hypothetical protein